MNEDRVCDALERISSGLQDVANAVRGVATPGAQLGFGDSPRAVVVYCNRQGGGVWYTLDFSSGADGVRVDIPERCLTARLMGFTFPEKEHRGKKNPKMRLHVDAGKQYILETGHDTALAKSLYADIASMSVEDLRHPVTIELRAGEADTVIFSKIYNKAGAAVNSDALKDVEFRTVVQMAVDNIKQARKGIEG